MAPCAIGRRETLMATIGAAGLVRPLAAAAGEQMMC